MSIYQEIILEHYKNPHNFGTIKDPTKKTSVSNPLCGDEIEMEIVFKKNKVSEIMFKGQGCAISQASASILTDFASGKSKDDLKKLDKNFMTKLLGIELGPNRIKCALLPLEALHKLI
ncbi:SUF system NifU family Fe-S cluster assembly protein [Candidatus Roizmanbacteria bacterium RIFCSPLOWO2_01_FULL_35_13]|uniref:SUF system NifU family Fe-S cluster assembly protein n=1 Tax=Candidatus Roizmanbacteria bacterium RIFCSPLOWO2_01_FULL_35_13 TaxID=1802055 RepID=A0A1F7I7W3_9BACT|nr:MAG: SUF system NifU family Fe-S cluster assembly protein [Candidatus Roizmanbacteria bacterium RIFCSPLOWO2_01_FULL_35_13]